MNNMLSLEEVKHFLDVEQEQIEKYLGNGKLHAYKIGGTYLRFRKEDVINLRFEVAPGKIKTAPKFSFLSRFLDFWKFNNFYIISLFLTGVIIYLIFGV